MAQEDNKPTDTEKDKQAALKTPVHEAIPPATKPNIPEPGHLGEPDKKGKPNYGEEQKQDPTVNATAGDASGKPVNAPGMSNS